MYWLMLCLSPIICKCMLLNLLPFTACIDQYIGPHRVARVLLRELPRDATLAVLPARRAGCREDCDLLPSCIRCSCPFLWAALAAIQRLAIWWIKKSGESRRSAALHHVQAARRTGHWKTSTRFQTRKVLMGCKLSCAIRHAVQKAPISRFILDSMNPD